MMEQNNQEACYAFISSCKNEDYLRSLTILSDNPDIQKNISDSQLLGLIQYKQEKDIENLNLTLESLKGANLE